MTQCEKQFPTVLCSRNDASKLLNIRENQRCKVPKWDFAFMEFFQGWSKFHVRHPSTQKCGNLPCKLSSICKRPVLGWPGSQPIFCIFSYLPEKLESKTRKTHKKYKTKQNIKEKEKKGENKYKNRLGVQS